MTGIEGAATWWHWRGRRGVDGLFEQYGVRKRSADFSKGGLNHWSGHFTRFPEKMRHITRKKVDWTALESGKSQVIKDILFLA